MILEGATKKWADEQFYLQNYINDKNYNPIKRLITFVLLNNNLKNKVMEIVLFFLVVRFLCGLWANKIGEDRTISKNGAMAFGFILGIWGVIIVTCWTKKMPVTIK